MNSNNQAQKGFKTFILTLVISLIVFSAIYYIVNSDTGSSEAPIKETSVIESKTESAKSSTLGDASLRANPAPEKVVKEEVAGAKTEEVSIDDDSTSVFEELATTNMNVEAQAVLAATDEEDENEEMAPVAPAVTTPESTVPDTGIFGPTFGIFFSAIALGLFAYFAFLGPRKMALESFEKEVLEDLED